MTMHLLGPQFSTINSRKGKSKIKVNEKFLKDFQEYNALMKRCNSKPKTLDEYIAYRSGKSKGPKKSINKLPSYAVSNHRDLYPSYGDQVGTIPAKPEKAYTGTVIKGVAVMHKSNLVPIASQQQAEDVAKMRRN